MPGSMPGDDTGPVGEDGKAKPCKVCSGFGDAFKRSRRARTQQQQQQQQSKDSGGAASGSGSASRPLTEAEKASGRSAAEVEAAAQAVADLSARQCPENRDSLGRGTWSFLHTMAAYYPDKPEPSVATEMQHFVSLFSKFYPCSECSEHMQNYAKVNPPDTSSGKALSQWMCRFHNDVNEIKGKPLFDCSKLDERWRTGWRDGSCDS